MRRRPILILLLLAATLAGCAASDHSRHGGGVALLLGIQNATNASLEVGWTVTALANGTVVWTKTEPLEAGGFVERISERLETRGEHRLDLSWGEGHAHVLSWDTADCMGTLHVALELREGGEAAETTRECHE